MLLTALFLVLTGLGCGEAQWSVREALRAQVTAREALGIDSSTELNVAVSGRSGTGKSSLLNALLGHGPDSPDAARVCETECTREVARHTGPRLRGVALWDTPGGGTESHPAATYFQDKRLNGFDFLLIVVSNRFTELDIAIANAATRAMTPFGFVRSKADMDLDSRSRRIRRPRRAIKWELRSQVVDNMLQQLPPGLRDAGRMFYLSSYVLDGTLDKAEYALDEDRLLEFLQEDTKCMRRGPLDDSAQFDFEPVKTSFCRAEGHLRDMLAIVFDRAPVAGSEGEAWVGWAESVGAARNKLLGQLGRSDEALQRVASAKEQVLEQLVTRRATTSATVSEAIANNRRVLEEKMKVLSGIGSANRSIASNEQTIRHKRYYADKNCECSIFFCINKLFGSCWSDRDSARSSIRDASSRLRAEWRRLPELQRRLPDLRRDLRRQAQRLQRLEAEGDQLAIAIGKARSVLLTASRLDESLGSALGFVRSHTDEDESLRQNLEPFILDFDELATDLSSAQRLLGPGEWEGEGSEDPVTELGFPPLTEAQLGRAEANLDRYEEALEDDSYA